MGQWRELRLERAPGSRILAGRRVAGVLNRRSIAAGAVAISRHPQGKSRGFVGTLRAAEPPSLDQERNLRAPRIQTESVIARHVATKQSRERRSAPAFPWIASLRSQ